MTKSPELWAFVLANLSLFFISSLLAGLCYLTYRRSQGNRSFAIATAGFGFIVIGGLVEPVYVLGITPNKTLTTAELFVMQGIEGTLIAFGLGLLFYAITQHRVGSPAEEPAEYTLTDEDLAWSGDD